MLELFCYKHTPEPEKLAIEARQQRLDVQYLGAAKIERRVGYGWDPPGGEQRRLFEKEFTAQLREETFYTSEEPTPDEVDPLDEYLGNLYMWVDRRHVYHGFSGPNKRHICYGD